MTAAVLHRIDRAARFLTPLLTTFLCAVLTKVPNALPHFAPIAPVLPLIAVYYWALFQPRLLPPLAAFAAGLLYDAMSGQPFGLHAGLFAAVHWIIGEQRRFFLGQPLSVLWAGFALIAAVMIGASWLLSAIYHWALVDPVLPICQAIMTGACFPPVFWLLSRCEAAFVKR